MSAFFMVCLSILNEVLLEERQKSNVKRDA
jgi:hypothetical protein